MHRLDAERCQSPYVVQWLAAEMSPLAPLRTGYLVAQLLHPIAWDCQIEWRKDRGLQQRKTHGRIAAAPFEAAPWHQRQALVLRRRESQLVESCP